VGRNVLFTSAAESHGLWPWMNAPTFGRDVAPLGRESGATGFARGAPLWQADRLCSLSRILLCCGTSGTHCSKTHIPRLSLYPKTLFHFPSEKDSSSTAFGNVCQRDFPLELHPIRYLTFRHRSQEYRRRSVGENSCFGEWKNDLPSSSVEEIISLRLEKGGHLDDWEARIRKLDQADGLEDLIKMKLWTDQIAMASGGFSLSIVYPFDTNRLHPIRLRK
jgi:hypothetical protein